MNRMAGQRETPSRAQTALRDRCHALGLPMWRFSATGELLGRPDEGGIFGTWLRTPFMERLMGSAAARWMESSDAPDPMELFPGCHLMPLEERQRRRRVSLGVAMILTRAVLDSEQFLQGCQAGSLDAEATARAMEPILRRDEPARDRVLNVLGWMNHDLAAMATHETHIETLSRQLAESYEEMSLLYRLREFMNELAQPQRFVRQACFELHTVLPFRWIAVRFIDDQQLARSLSAKTFTAGDLPCSKGRFEQLVTGLMKEMQPGRSVVLDPDAAAPFGSSGAQVLAFPIARDGAVIGAFMCGDKSDDAEITNIELKMVEATAGYVSILLENSGLYEDQHAMFLGTLRALTATIDAKDPYTCGHSERVANLAADLARAYGLPEAQVERVRVAGLVHDIGKIGVPEDVLRKPGRLTDDEFEQIKRHPEIGYHILHDIPQLADVLPGVLYHHERIDGRGYPHGIDGDAIPLVAKLIALADSFDAMSSNRTYRSAMSREQVLTEIRKCAGKQFDPELAELFVKLDFTEYDRDVARHLAGRDGSEMRGAA